jgi:hypothetical protein
MAMTTKLHREHHAQAALTSYVEYDSETGLEVCPLEQHPLGLILHTPDDSVPMRLQRLKRSPAGGKATSVGIARTGRVRLQTFPRRLARLAISARMASGPLGARPRRGALRRAPQGWVDFWRLMDGVRCWRWPLGASL